jgi:hypothetical protein
MLALGDESAMNLGPFRAFFLGTSENPGKEKFAEFHF